MPKESTYQSRLIKHLKARYSGCVVLKNDSAYLQGFPDLTVLFGRTWAVLEVKASASESYQPNQEFYIDHCGRMSFAAMICPENEEEVLHELDKAFTIYS